MTDPDELEKMLRQVRERGYALELEELAFGRACLAAPIRDRTGAIVAALSVSGPLSAMDLPTREESLAMQVIEQADQISSGLGYHASAAVELTRRTTSTAASRRCGRPEHQSRRYDVPSAKASTTSTAVAARGRTGRRQLRCIVNSQTVLAPS